MESKFFKVVADVFEINKEQLNWDLKRDQISEWDSLAHIVLISELEEEFNLSIPIEEVPEIKTLWDFKKYLGL